MTNKSGQGKQITSSSQTAPGGKCLPKEESFEQIIWMPISNITTLEMSLLGILSTAQNKKIKFCKYAWA